MTGFVALLRGVNVGGNKKIAMADLRELLADLGFGEVKTLLQSGNAVFSGKGTPASIGKKIEKALDDGFGLTTRCLVRTAKEIQQVIDGHPLADVADNGSRMMAIFLSESLDAKQAAAVEELDPAAIKVGDRVIYQWCPDGILAAPEIVPFLLKQWKVHGTARNWNTVTKIGAAIP
ncbi:DUF1697 domain-containing protein [Actinokineospora sp. HUAS TT18]|uniref:DUF1697 domain-containing protein n=1 Tax=Actinokineospora sp. HUAS TT18 TaxID=3447451 RepID=UPI003F51BBAA